jgi:predicted nucleotidyltransferase
VLEDEPEERIDRGADGAEADEELMKGAVDFAPCDRRAIDQEEEEPNDRNEISDIFSKAIDTIKNMR